MSIGVVGRKVGMTRIFTQDGKSIPVTVIEVEANRVTQVKSNATAGHFAKAKVEAGRGLWEFRLSDAEIANYAVGAEVKVDLFNDIKMVDVTGISKGKGFAGTVKRWNFRTQDMTHGNSRSHRVPGSTGQNQTPGRVFKGKHMCGHMGAEQVTVQCLDVVRVDVERNVLLVKGD